MKKYFIAAAVLIIVIGCSSSKKQTIDSNEYFISATMDDPVYTTYAAVKERSQFVIDQGYHLYFYDPDSPLKLVTDQAGDWGISFNINGKAISKLSDYYKQPEIYFTSNDNFGMIFYPVKNLKVDFKFWVYSSKAAVQKISFYNQSQNDLEIILANSIQTDKIFNGLDNDNTKGGILYNHTEKPDGWITGHNIPFQEKYTNYLYSPDEFEIGFVIDFFNDRTPIDSTVKTNIITMDKSFVLNPGESETFDIIKIADKNKQEVLKTKKSLPDFEEEFITPAETELRYKNIPEINFKRSEYEHIYKSAFSLIEQCMLPPEGKCNYNYYVFSREPQWGWGHGGQVFHESIVMLAYVYMNPQSAMNSQRVFMERQYENGYINYRTGPYLDEQIETNGQLTSSAPWYNWINYEIFKVTGDKKFLKEAYESGKKFYNYYTANRDSDGDGLCEWGAHAVLESVRDARVAVWDKVGDPVNFDAVDCNAMLVNEAKSLEAMANELGLTAEAESWKEDYVKRTGLINKYMWDDETGFYYHVDKKDNDFSFESENDLKRKEIIGFLPLWAGVADSVQAVRLMEHMKNPDTFWRKFGVPTLSADDPYYNPIGYWNGPIWVQWQYLLMRGMIDYGYYRDAGKLMEKVLNNVGNQLKTDHYFWEFYSADDYQAGWNKTYIWTGITARMLIDIDQLHKQGKL